MVKLFPHDYLVTMNIFKDYFQPVRRRRTRKFSKVSLVLGAVILYICVGASFSEKSDSSASSIDEENSSVSLISTNFATLKNSTFRVNKKFGKKFGKKLNITLVTSSPAPFMPSSTDPNTSSTSDPSSPSEASTDQAEVILDESPGQNDLDVPDQIAAPSALQFVNVVSPPPRAHRGFVPQRSRAPQNFEKFGVSDSLLYKNEAVIVSPAAGGRGRSRNVVTSEPTVEDESSFTSANPNTQTYLREVVHPPEPQPQDQEAQPQEIVTSYYPSSGLREINPAGSGPSATSKAYAPYNTIVESATTAGSTGGSGPFGTRNLKTAYNGQLPTASPLSISKFTVENSLPSSQVNSWQPAVPVIKQQQTGPVYRQRSESNKKNDQQRKRVKTPKPAKVGTKEEPLPSPSRIRFQSFGVPDQFEYPPPPPSHMQRSPPPPPSSDESEEDGPPPRGPDGPPRDGPPSYLGSFDAGDMPKVMEGGFQAAPPPPPPPPVPVLRPMPTGYNRQQMGGGPPHRHHYPRGPPPPPPPPGYQGYGPFPGGFPGKDGGQFRSGPPRNPQDLQNLDVGLPPPPQDFLKFNVPSTAPPFHHLQNNPSFQRQPYSSQQHHHHHEKSVKASPFSLSAIEHAHSQNGFGDFKGFRGSSIPSAQSPVPDPPLVRLKGPGPQFPPSENIYPNAPSSEPPTHNPEFIQSPFGNFSRGPISFSQQTRFGGSDDGPPSKSPPNLKDGSFEMPGYDGPPTRDNEPPHIGESHEDGPPGPSNDEKEPIEINGSGDGPLDGPLPPPSAESRPPNFAGPSGEQNEDGPSGPKGPSSGERGPPEPPVSVSHHNPGPLGNFGGISSSEGDRPPPLSLPQRIPPAFRRPSSGEGNFPSAISTQQQSQGPFSSTNGGSGENELSPFSTKRPNLFPTKPPFGGGFSPFKPQDRPPHFNKDREPPKHHSSQRPPQQYNDQGGPLPGFGGFSIEQKGIGSPSPGKQNFPTSSVHGFQQSGYFPGNNADLVLKANRPSSDSDAPSSPGQGGPYNGYKPILSPPSGGPPRFPPSTPPNAPNLINGDFQAGEGSFSNEGSGSGERNRAPAGPGGGHRPGYNAGFKTRPYNNHNRPPSDIPQRNPSNGPGVANFLGPGFIRGGGFGPFGSPLKPVAGPPPSSPLPIPGPTGPILFGQPMETPKIGTPPPAFKTPIMRPFSGSFSGPLPGPFNTPMSGSPVGPPGVPAPGGGIFKSIMGSTGFPFRNPLGAPGSSEPVRPPFMETAPISGFPVGGPGGPFGSSFSPPSGPGPSRPTAFPVLPFSSPMRGITGIMSSIMDAFPSLILRPRGPPGPPPPPPPPPSGPGSVPSGSSPQGRQPGGQPNDQPPEIEHDPNPTHDGPGGSGSQERSHEVSNDNKHKHSHGPAPSSGLQGFGNWITGLFEGGEDAPIEEQPPKHSHHSHAPIKNIQEKPVLLKAKKPFKGKPKFPLAHPHKLKYPLVKVLKPFLDLAHKILSFYAKFSINKEHYIRVVSFAGVYL